MDVPDETHRESAGDASLDDPNKLPVLSRSATTLDTAAKSSSPVPVSSVVAVPALRPRKSLRARPNQTLQRQHAAPPSPLNNTHRSPRDQSPHPRLTKMSLFSLFTKPKVERQRLYAEPGLEDAQAQDVDAHRGRARPSSSKSYAGRASRMASPQEPPPQLSSDRRMRHFDPLPLFQVWPQTTKHGQFEMTTAAPEMVLQKSKSRMIGNAFFAPVAENPSLQTTGRRGSMESRVTVKSALKHVASGSLSGMNLPKKIFVLVTSGYLLQYAETGPSDRLPEKILQLGRHSAAYASDLIPGKYHVLHVEQAVDQDGTAIANTNSFFSKIGLRSQTAKKMASNFLLVMPGAQELEDWMTAIRLEIEKHGGKRARSDSSTARPKTSEAPMFDLRNTPSLSHRYQIKRDTMMFNITTLPEEATKELPPPPSAISSEGEMEHSIVIAPKVFDDMIAEEEVVVLPSRNGSDASSVSSSSAVSVNQQKLEALRESIRISHSTMTTASASSPSRSNSVSSTPPSEAKEVCESHVDATAPGGPFRRLSSYAVPNGRYTALPMLHESPSSGMDKAFDSPMLGRHHVPAYGPSSAPKKSLSMARSVPNLRFIEETHYTSTLPMPPTAEVPERPDSFVGDLPDPMTWATKCSPTVRTSQLHSYTNSDVYGHTRPLRAGTQSFSLPLRINTQVSTTQRPVIKRASQSADADARILSPIPAATTLVAKVDFAARTGVEYHGFSDIPSPPPMRPLPSPPTPSFTPSQTTKRGNSVRLSLFPCDVASSPPAITTPPAKQLTRSPSTIALSATGTQAHIDAMALKRPSSMQVRANYAPFLSSVRPSPTSPGTETGRSPTTVPIRNLKSSRSVATMQTVYQRHFMKAEPVNFSTRRVIDEESDQATPLPQRSASPSKEGYFSRPSSRTRGPRVSTSLPELDFGIPVVGLGPPAPPPQTPLPEIPTHSRPASRNAGTRTGTPIGVAIGETEEEHGGVALGIEVS